MIIDWFSPLAPSLSPSRDLTETLMPQLASQEQLRVWHKKNEKLPTKGAEPILWQAHANTTVDILNSGDMAIYNIGQQAELHWEILQLSMAHSGIVILHDSAFSSLIHTCDPKMYKTWMWRLYGEAGRNRAHQPSPVNGDELAAQHSLIEVVTDNACGVVTHNPYTAEQLQKSYAGPIALLPLPYPADQSTPPLPHKKISQNEAWNLTALGPFEPQQTLERILEALASTDRQNFHCTLIGELQDKSGLVARLDRLGLTNRVRLFTEQPPAPASDHLVHSQLALNLCPPSNDQAMRNQLEIAHHALPCLVPNLGWFADLPSATVFYLEPGKEDSDFTQWLQQFFHDPSQFYLAGRNSQQHLRQKHTPENYAKNLLALCQEAITWRPAVGANGLTRRLVQITPFMESNHANLYHPALAKITEVFSPES